MLKKSLKPILILLGLSYVFLMLGNGVLSLTNPDEVFYTQTAHEMVQHKSWSTPYLFGQPQFEKPVFLYWLIRVCFVIFGNTPFSARFSPALFAILGVLAVYLLALAAFKNEKKAFISGFILMSGGLYIGMARTVFTDMIFSVLILFALAAFYWGYAFKEKKGIGIILFFVFCALAVLTKGPLGLIIPLLSVLLFLFVKKELKFLFCKYSFWGFLLFAGVSFPWYILMIKQYGHTFTHEFFYNDHYRRIIEAEHAASDTWYFYPLSMVGCVFPWSLFTLAALFYFFKDLKRQVNPIYPFLLCWIGAVFFIFEPAHSKLTSYILPFFPALAVITGDFIYNTTLLENKNRVFFKLSLITVSILFMLPVAILVMVSKYAHYFSDKAIPYALAALLFILALTVLFYVLRYKFFRAMMFLSLSLPLSILFVFFFMHQDIEPYVSSKLISEYLLKTYPEADLILCSKPYLRGVHYYTDKPVAAIAIPGRQFFSPHPVPLLDTDEKMAAFLKPRPVTYCILKKSSIDDIDRMTKVGFKYTLLKVVGSEYLVKVERR